MKLHMSLGTALILALAACGDTQPPEPEPANMSSANAIESMPEGQRNAVFIRAILDAGEECQGVERSERRGEHEGFPVWVAHCTGGGGSWAVIVTGDGNAVIHPDPSQRQAAPPTAPANSQ